MTSYFSYRVKLIGNQKSKLADAIQNKSAVTLRLSNDELSNAYKNTNEQNKKNQCHMVKVWISKSVRHK